MQVVNRTVVVHREGQRALVLRKGDVVPDDVTIDNEAVLEDVGASASAPKGKAKASIDDSGSQTEPAGDDLDGMSHAELDAHAEKHKIDLSGARSRKDKIKLIRAAS